MDAHALPAPPSPREERILLHLLERGFLGEVFAQLQDPPPPAWHAQPFGIPREAGGILAGLLFPHASPRGLVLLGHPGIGPAKGYFHRGDRIPFLLDHGFAVATFDHGGFGESDAPSGLYHREWADVLRWARRRFPHVPISLWGVSLGGYFAHHALATDELGIESAIFEQVAPDLFGYRVKGMPMLRTGSLLSRALAPGAARWFPARAHALHVKADRILYLGGARDAGISVEDAHALVRDASPLARNVMVPDAAHLEAWKLGGEKVRSAVRDALVG